MYAKIDRWVPISERLPEPEGFKKGITDHDHIYSADVLFTVLNIDNGKTFVDYGYIVDGKWYLATEDYIIPDRWEVIAWRPLPKPYIQIGGNEEC